MRTCAGTSRSSHASEGSRPPRGDGFNPSQQALPPVGSDLIGLIAPPEQSGVLHVFAEAFDSARQADLKDQRCYFGVALVTERSGRIVLIQRRLAANRRLVDVACHWAMIAVQRDAVSRANCHALRSQGHKYARALRSGADRLLGVVCKMIEAGQTFDPEK